ncbi:hypothetical protein [Avrilella dinanensis]|uniref:YD repeat-containing protein n=1 Tax=Avrilella dinanensis TaxID=2008672 RepID=A0A2M9R623_9FLAO|nr:hypothetical protein [Avrilella dinanensis]PJR04328.1 hypothetical protein CDL10_07110 [Avrilella dinanensis]
MRKIFGLLSLFITYSATAQEIVLPGSTTNIEHAESIATGNVNPSIELFNIETSNPNLNLQARLTFNPFAFFYEDILGYEVKSFFDKGWDINIIPNITKYVDRGSMDDELYYSEIVKCSPDINHSTTYNFSVFDVQGVFTFEEQNGQLAVKTLYSSDYIDIDVDYDFSTVSGQEIFQINTIALIDKNGTRYEFNEKQKSAFYVSGMSCDNEFHEINRSFLLSEVKDKFGTTLLTYEYYSYPDSINQGSQTFQYDQKYLMSIYVPEMSRVDFILNQTQKRYTSVRVSRSSGPAYMLERVIELPSGGSNKKIIFNNGDYQNGNQETEYEYKISSQFYPNYTNSYVEITSPFKGITRYEFEPHDYGYHHTPDNPAEFPEYTTVEEQLPVTNLSTSNFSKYSFHVPDEYLNDDKIYLSYATRVPPGSIDPGGGQNAGNVPIDLMKSNNTIVHTFGLPNQQIQVNNILNNYKSNFTNNTFYVGGDALFYEYTGVKVKRVYEVLDPTIEKKEHLGGYRIRKIINKDYDGTIVSAKTFTYRMKDDPYRSSGVVDVFYVTGHTPVHSKYAQTPLIIYYTSVITEEEGKGKVVYDYSDAVIGWHNLVVPLSNLSSIPSAVYTYNEAGKLLSHDTNEFELVEIDPNGNGYFKPIPILKKMTTTAKSYAPGLFTSESRTAVIETNFDTISRQVTHRKITDMVTSEVFEEQHYHLKMGNAYYQTAVKKYKNGTIINQSKAEYAPVNNGTLANVYALEKTFATKENRPWQLEKEITLYDNKGKILEYKTKEGVYVSLIWGYHDSKVVAELKNQRYAQIAAGTITNIKTYSNSENASLETALNSLRNAHPEAFITTYTYFPLVGLRSVTDLNGHRTTYQYDQFNRLHKVLNHEGDVVKEYDYNFKN